MYGWFDFSGGSNAGIFGIGIYGGRIGRKDWWRECLVKPVWRVGHAAHNAKWKVLHRLHPAHRYHMVDTGLTPAYYDVDTLMLNACFTLLCRYVEREMGGAEEIEKFNRELTQSPDPNAPDGWENGQVDRQAESVKLYRWWKTERHADQKRCDEMLTKLYGRARETVKINGVWTSRVVTPWSEEDEALEPVFRALEKKIDDDEQQMLHRLIDIRRSLWT